jgi:hypothetical protein
LRQIWNFKMATSEEKHELVEDIKRPIRHYRIMLWGYGGESAYMRLTKEQYEYWNQRKEEEDERDILVDYMLDEDREEVADVPPAMDFMGDPEDLEGPRYAWHDAPNEITHQYGVDYSSARITITELDSEDYSANIIEDVVEGVELDEFVNEHEIEWFSDEVEESESDYMLQFYSSEKGTFFEGIFSTAGKFDPSKLTINSTEYFNGDDTIETITYDGEEIENMGGDTNGKGYTVAIWANV